MYVKIFNLDGGEEDALITLAPGTHTLGRGPALQCSDKRVSRNQANLEIAGNDVKLTSLHINPCFLKNVGSKTVTILQKDSTAKLNDGDAFAFLPDAFWFKIKIIEDLPDAAEESTSKQDHKRHLSDPEQGTSEKKVKLENGNSVNEDQIHNLENGSDIKLNEEDKVEVKIELDIKLEKVDEQSIQNMKTESKIEQENCNAVTTSNDGALNIPCNSQNIKESSNEENQELTANNGTNANEGQNISHNENKKEDLAGKYSDEATSDKVGTSKPRREKCWYGAQCYRKNPVHRQDFSHPGDSDFESDPDDNRPTCSFGAACYRKNKDHRRVYKHPPGKPPKQQQKKRARKKVDRLNAVDYNDSDLSDEMSSDPYEADGDSEDYVGDSDSGSDTDWEDSQNVDEDSENVKRMVKEAKRFMKK